VTGSSPPCCGLRLNGMRASHCCCVTSVPAMRNGLVRLTRRGTSSACRRGSPGGLPIRKLPAGTSTMRIPSELTTASPPAGGCVAWPYGGKASTATMTNAEGGSLRVTAVSCAAR
jgi:hypothetical protein